MTYSKPEVNALPAISAITQTPAGKGLNTIKDAVAPHKFNATPLAYEADE
jgi:hypothetical protein